MPAELMPGEAIPEIAARITSPAILMALRRMKEVGFVQDTGNLPPETVEFMQRLGALGLVDARSSGS